MTKITIPNQTYGIIENCPESYFKTLRKLASYVPPGHMFTPQGKLGWSGIINLITDKGRFQLGLLYMIEKFLKENNIEYILEDNRPVIIDEAPLDINAVLSSLNMVPRDYQLDILEATKKNTRGIIRAATGAGKTLVSAMIAAHFNKQTVIYVVGLDLLSQFYNLFCNIFGEDQIGYIGDGTCKIGKITIASVWTVGKSLGLKSKDLEDEDIKNTEKFNENNKIKIFKCIQNAKVHMFDESHMGGSQTIKSISKKIHPERLYGLSGTPYKGDGADIVLTSIFGEKIADVSASLLIERGVLSQPIIKFIPVPKHYTTVQKYTEIYKEYIVENSVRNNLILKHTKILIDKKYIPLVLFKTINHGKMLFKMFKAAGIKCEMLNGKDTLKRRNEIKEQLNSGEIQCILASIIFDTGIDLPILSGLVLAGSGRSTTRANQRIGRVIRSMPGKTYSAIVDFYDNIRILKKHSKIRYEAYCAEEGFKVIPCEGLKE